MAYAISWIVARGSSSRRLAVRIRLTGGARVKEARGVVLTHQDMRATNTFADPKGVKPAAHPVKVVADAIVLSLPKQAIVLVECEVV